MNIRECVIITTNTVFILKKSQTSQNNKIGELIIYVIFRGNGKATIISVYLEEGQNRNRPEWLDIGDDLVVDLVNPEEDGDDPRGDGRAQEVDADDQDPVVRSGEK